MHAVRRNLCPIASHGLLYGFRMPSSDGIPPAAIPLEYMHAVSQRLHVPAACYVCHTCCINAPRQTGRHTSSIRLAVLYLL